MECVEHLWVFVGLTIRAGQVTLDYECLRCDETDRRPAEAEQPGTVGPLT